MYTAISPFRSRRSVCPATGRGPPVSYTHLMTSAIHNAIRRFFIGTPPRFVMLSIAVATNTTIITGSKKRINDLKVQKTHIYFVLNIKVTIDEINRKYIKKSAPNGTDFIQLDFALAAQNLDNLVLDDFPHHVAAGAEVLAGVEVLGIEGQVLADGGSHEMCIRDRPFVRREE